ncbi:MAG: metallophosphoesterase [Candidatus Eremiobacteraeota bacterium]|nr:metallophosphoesterase [Candidatus Eremiobacteraeota bacterium]
MGHRLRRILRYTLVTFLAVLVLAASLEYRRPLYPYLQTPTSRSVQVTWRSPLSGEAFVEYGLRENELSRRTEASSNRLGPVWWWHRAWLSDLEPDKTYYYRVITGRKASSVLSFRTQPVEGTSKGHYRIVVLGDHQRWWDKRFQTLVERAQGLAEERFGGAVEETINLVVFLGDMVQHGDCLWQWDRLHITQSSKLTSRIPSLTVVGNHDLGASGDLTTYSDLFTSRDVQDFHYGEPGSEGDHYYATQKANIVFLCFDSDHPTAEQTAWIASVLTRADKDPGVDWVVVISHHPLWCEELPADEAWYSQQEVLPLLLKSDKLVLILSGHAHLYSRGSLSERGVYHVISGGASFDQLWEETPDNNVDYAEVQKTIDRQNFQILDFDLEARVLRVESWSIGSSSLGGGFDELKLIDSFGLTREGSPPQKPSLVQTGPGEFSGSPYQGEEPLVSAEFLFVDQDGKELTRVRRDTENYFGNLKTEEGFQPLNHAPADVTKIAADDALLNARQVRVRYRDASLRWSDWSNSLTVEVPR